MARKVNTARLRALRLHEDIEQRQVAHAEPEAQRTESALALASIIVGMISFVLLAAILAPAAIIMGAVAVGQRDSRGYLGIMLGVLASCLWIVLVVFLGGIHLLSILWALLMA